MKTWKHLISGLLALTLLASLSCAALAEEPTAKTEKAPKPAGQFSQWFPRFEQDPAAPEAVEAVLAKMGTAVRQSKTKNGVTATLNGAIWDGDTLRMSLTVNGPQHPRGGHRRDQPLYGGMLHRPAGEGLEGLRAEGR